MAERERIDGRTTTGSLTRCEDTANRITTARTRHARTFSDSHFPRCELIGESATKEMASMEMSKVAKQVGLRLTGMTENEIIRGRSDAGPPSGYKPNVSQIPSTLQLYVKESSHPQSLGYQPIVKSNSKQTASVKISQEEKQLGARPKVIIERRKAHESCESRSHAWYENISPLSSPPTPLDERFSYPEISVYEPIVERTFKQISALKVSSKGKSFSENSKGLTEYEKIRNISDAGPPSGNKQNVFQIPLPPLPANANVSSHPKSSAYQPIPESTSKESASMEISPVEKQLGARPKEISERKKAHKNLKNRPRSWYKNFVPEITLPSLFRPKSPKNEAVGGRTFKQMTSLKLSIARKSMRAKPKDKPIDGCLMGKDVQERSAVSFNNAGTSSSVPRSQSNRESTHISQMEGYVNNPIDNSKVMLLKKNKTPYEKNVEDKVIKSLFKEAKKSEKYIQLDDEDSRYCLHWCKPNIDEYAKEDFSIMWEAVPDPESQSTTFKRESNPEFDDYMDLPNVPEPASTEGASLQSQIDRVFDTLKLE